MSQTDTLLTMSSIQSDRARPRTLVSLIEVPAVAVAPVRRVDTTAQARVRGHWQGRRPHRAKRRLRREVRIGCCALLIMAPLLSACTVGWSSGPFRAVPCSIADSTVEPQGLGSHSPPRDVAAKSELAAIGLDGVVMLSVEPVVMPPGTETDVPVVFPGYVLPDDSLEGPAHEGS